MLNERGPRGLGDLLIELALAVLIAAFFFWLAVQFLLQVWGWLLGASIVAGSVYLVICWRRRRNGGW